MKKTLLFISLFIAIILVILYLFPMKKDELKTLPPTLQKKKTEKKPKKKEIKKQTQIKTKKAKKEVVEKFDPYKHHPCEIIDYFLKSGDDPGDYLKSTFGTTYRKYKNKHKIQIDNYDEVYKISSDIDTMKEFMPIFLEKKQHLFYNISSSNKKIEAEAKEYIRSMYETYTNDFDYQSETVLREAKEFYNKGEYLQSLKELTRLPDYNIYNSYYRTADTLFNLATTPQEVALGFLMIRKLPLIDLTFIKSLRKKLPESIHDDKFIEIRELLFHEIHRWPNEYFHINNFFEIGNTIAPLDPKNKNHQKTKALNLKRRSILATIMDRDSCDDRNFIDFCDKQCRKQ